MFVCRKRRLRRFPFSPSPHLSPEILLAEKEIPINLSAGNTLGLIEKGACYEADSTKKPKVFRTLVRLIKNGVKKV